MSRARLWLRVSTDRQDEENQRAGCERRAQYGDGVRPWALGPAYQTRVTSSGPEFEADPERQRVFADARKGLFEVLVIWALDRWTRSGILGLFQDVETLKKSGVRIVSVQEPWAENELLLAIAGWQAQQEKLRRQERTQAAIDRRKGQIATAGGFWKTVKGADGRPTPKWVTSFGRPRREDLKDPRGPAIVRALTLRLAGLGWGTVAATLAREGLGDFPKRTLQRACERVTSDDPGKAA